MKNSKRLAAFLLVAALMAGLFAGCGSTEGEQATDVPGQEATGLVWTSEFTDLGGAAGYVSSVSFAGVMETVKLSTAGVWLSASTLYQ